VLETGERAAAAQREPDVFIRFRRETDAVRGVHGLYIAQIPGTDGMARSERSLRGQPNNTVQRRTTTHRRLLLRAV
jgi:hypothetical protein